MIRRNVTSRDSALLLPLSNKIANLSGLLGIDDVHVRLKYIELGYYIAEIREPAPS